MKDRLSVGQLLTRLLGAGILMSLLIGVVGAIGVLRSTSSVTELTDELAPATRSNALILEDMLNAETYLRGYALASDEVSLTNYRASIEHLLSDERPLLRYANASRPALQDQALEQRAAWQRWLAEYARPRITQGGGDGTFKPLLYERGVRLFNDIRRVNGEIRMELDNTQGQARADAVARLRATNALIAGISILGAAILFLLGHLIVQRVRRPLDSLTDTVARLAAGETSARVEPHGPPEIRRVGAAINNLADESDRARDVEAAVQSQLREMDSVKTDFVSNVSHELRTPLTIITGYLELLDDELSAEISPQHANMIAVTRRNVMRLRELIEDLLTLNRAEQSDTTLEVIDLRQVVREVGHDMSFSASSRGIRVHRKLPRGAVLALGDASQLHRAILNLMTNAVKFSPDGSTVELILEKTETDAAIKVIDHGIGIPRGEVPKLGSRFFRASNAIKSEIAGTGLGLRIVQTIVSNHHGTMTLDSQEGVGTAVTVLIPLRDDRADQPAPLAGEQTASPPG